MSSAQIGDPTRVQARMQRRLQQLRRDWSALSDHQQVGVCLGGMAGGVVLWALFWPVPTEVVGMGVLIYPNNAGVLNARAGGQVQSSGGRQTNSMR